MLGRQDGVWNWAITRCRSTSPTPPTNFHSFSPAHAQNATILNLRIPPWVAPPRQPYLIHMRTNHRHNQKILDSDGSVGGNSGGFDAHSDFPTQKNKSSKLNSNKVHTLTWTYHHHWRPLQLPTNELRYPIPPRKPNQNLTPLLLSFQNSWLPIT